MATCSICGCEFSLSSARRRIGRIYGAGMYDDAYPDGDVCGDCADDEIGTNMAAGAEVFELMGPGWDEDD